MSQIKSIKSTGTTSVRIAAIRLKSANKHIFRALISLASATLLVRVMGMVNQVVVTSRFGAGATMDAYVVASTLPIIIAQIISSAVESSVTPTYARVRSQGKREQASILFSTLLNILVVGSALLTIIMVIFGRQMILIAAPGLDSYRAELAGKLVPYIYPVILLMVVISFLECILNTEGQFGWPAYAGLLVPLTTAVLVFLAGKSEGIVMLCVGMVVGLCLQICAFVVRARRAGLTYRPTIAFTSEVSTILAAGWPVLFGAMISMASPLVDQFFASTLSEGSISALSYSLKLVSVFTGVIFVSVGRAALPYLSRQVAMNDMKAFKETLRLYLWVVGIGTMILSALMIVLAHPIVQFLFQRGAFSAEDTNRTATTLIGFLVGLTSMAFGFMGTKVFSALNKTKVLMRIAFFTVTANILFDFIFAHFWQSQGIALATSAVYFCIMLIMYFTLRHLIGDLHLFTPPPEILQLIQKIGININQFYLRWVTWKGKNLSSFNVSFYLRRQIARGSIVITVFASGVAGVFLNSLYTLRISLGSVVMLFLLRYRYVLLVVWVLYNGPNSLPIFRGSNILVGLTIPTLLSMTCLPIKETFKRLPALAFLCIYLLWVFASIGISAIGVGAFLTAWFILLDCAAVAILTIHVLTTYQRLMKFIDIILLLSIFVALYGIYSYITRQNGVPDDTNPAFFRAGSVFGPGPQGFALFLSLVIPLAFYRTFTLRGFKRVSCSILVFFFLGTLVLTFTRTALICVPLSILMMALFMPSKIRNAMLISFLSLFAIAFLLTIVGNVPIFNRFSEQDVGSLNGRTFLWDAVLNNFDPTQLLGNGLAASNNLLTTLHVGVNGQGLIGTSPHSLFLGTLYDHGIIGLFLLVVVFIALLANLTAKMRKAAGDQRMLSVTVFAILASAIIQSIDTNDLWTQGISIYFWILVALPFANCWYAPKQPPEAKKEIYDKTTEPHMKILQPIERTGK